MDIGALFTPPDWGTIPDWLAAFGTIGAVWWALHIGLRDGKRLDEERREAKQDREAAATERALFRAEREAGIEAEKRRLAAQVTVVAEPAYSADRVANGFEGRGISWRIHNGGNEPISMVIAAQREIDPEGFETGQVNIAKSWHSIEAGGAARS